MIGMKPEYVFIIWKKEVFMQKAIFLWKLVLTFLLQEEALLS